MLVSIPFTGDEQAAVEDGQAALDQLLQHQRPDHPDWQLNQCQGQIRR